MSASGLRVPMLALLSRSAMPSFARSQARTATAPTASSRLFALASDLRSLLGAPTSAGVSRSKQLFPTTQTHVLLPTALSFLLPQHLRPALFPVPTAALVPPPSLTSTTESIGAVDEDLLSNAVWQMNRNARWPKTPNHGARPCSRIGRKSRRPYQNLRVVIEKSWPKGRNNRTNLELKRLGVEKVFTLKFRKRKKRLAKCRRNPG